MTNNFITVSMRNVKVGEMFLPIERTGQPVYVVRKRRWEKEWRKADRSFVATGMCRGVDKDGRDGVFSLYDWAVVRREIQPPRPRPETRMAEAMRQAAARR